MGKQRSLRSKAVNLVSDFTTVLLNPISDKPSKNPPHDNETDSEKSHVESNSEEGTLPTVEGPDTSSFSAFLYSLLKDDYFSAEREGGQHSKAPVKAESESETETEARPEIKPEVVAEPENVTVVKESGGKRGLISRGRQSIGKAMSYAARLAWYRNQTSGRMSNHETKTDDKNGCQDGGNLSPKEGTDEILSLGELPDMSENSLLLSQKTRVKLYASLPSLVKGRKWVLLYSTWRHGISLSTLYRKSMLCPGLSLLVVGDRRGAVFGGLVEAPLKPSKSKRYQGSNSTFLFTDVPGQPIIYRPTGANRYYTVCSPDFLALGGGQHFALYLDSDLLNGSSASSETYGNSCLSLSEDFVVKEVELWGFVYASRYEEILALSQNELPGICRW
ncbi:hypothetical protein BVRB_6g135150 [Beta vulgaris subsp. vulgaris]|uniref:oxidation resistance protein 1 n=1 Tax=Beta vulgaris subsp. vulgaris TaxID=3555 RepID=UPI00053F5E44|nr:oxidation resistance protein 1 [Beta vulgaris subsp. vulgaris]KMT08791.1 hypothetical protein BVRB_6g135150 [Beta vulgaris subsp. vulgaris]